MKEEFQDRLRIAMSVREMRAIDLHNKTGVPKGAISYYLSGKSEPKADRLYIICKALDVSEAWMLGYDVKMERSESQKNSDAIADIAYQLKTDKEFFSIVSAIQKLDAEKRSSLLTFLK